MSPVRILKLTTPIVKAPPPQPVAARPAAAKPAAAANSDCSRSIREIIAEVAAKHGLTIAEMLSHRRARPLAYARQEAYWRCLKETVFSLTVIARHFANRDHTTIDHGAKVYERRLKAANSGGAGQGTGDGAP